jgi:hypothetical protein
MDVPIVACAVAGRHREVAVPTHVGDEACIGGVRQQGLESCGRPTGLLWRLEQLGPGGGVDGIDLLEERDDAAAIGAPGFPDAHMCAFSEDTSCPDSVSARAVAR